MGWAAASLILSVVIASWMVLTDTADWLGTIEEGSAPTTALWRRWRRRGRTGFGRPFSIR